MSRFESDPQDASEPGQVDALEAIMTPLFELSSEELPAAVERLCLEHPEQAHEVRRRLHGIRLLLGASPQASTESFPERLGEFRLIERLGGGGMGVVFRAEQLSLGREVALKLIRPEQLYFAGARERFRRETEAVAKLQHPGIVAIHTVGEDQGVPFFAMQLLPGRTLSELLFALAGAAPESLGVDDLFAGLPPQPTASQPALVASTWAVACCAMTRELALALAHAHGRGVLHRDMKPSNAMLLPSGRTVLLDFGLTSAAQEEKRGLAERVTRTGSQVGTLAYMSPEQVAGSKLDARTDVYSLGATLFELLTLRVPFEGGSALELQAQILQGARASIRARNPRVSRDLETVCFKAMALRAQDRYQRAEDFARDLQNVIERRPIEARAPGPIKRALRWTQRRPALASSTALALLLISALPSGLYLQQRAFNRDLKQLIELEKSARDLGDAERSAALAVTEFLEQLFEYASPARSLGEDVPVGVLLEQGALRIERELGDQPAVKARLLKAMGNAYSWLGSNEKAARFLQESLALQVGLKGTMDSTAMQWRMELARVKSALGEYLEADRLLAQVLDQAAPRDPAALRAYARSRGVRGTLQSRLGNYAEAEASFRWALEVLGTIADGEHFAAAACMEDYASYLSETERHQEALPVFEASLAMKRRILPAAHPDLINSELHLAQCLESLNDIEAAVAHIDVALEGARSIHGEQHSSFARVLLIRSELEIRQGQHAMALAGLRQALGIFESVVGQNNPEIAWTLNNLGMQLQHQGALREAQTHLQRALELHRQLHSNDHKRLAISLVNLAEVLAARGSLEQAMALVVEGVGMHRRLLGPSPSLANALAVEAGILAQGGRFLDGERALNEAFAMLEPASEWAGQRQMMHASLALILNLSGKPAQAEEKARAAISEAQSDGRWHAQALYFLGWALALQGDRTSALGYLNESIEMFARVFPDGHPERAYALNQLGVSLLSEDSEQALLAFQEALELRRRLEVTPHWLSISLINLGAAHFARGEDELALPLAQEATRLRQKHFDAPDMDLANALFLEASILAKSSDPGSALAATRDCLDQQRALFPPGHAVPARTAGLLGDLYLRLEDYAAAEAALLDAHAGLLGKRSESGALKRVKAHLVQLYEATGQAHQAQAFRP